MSAPRLSPKQREILDAVCRSNGGGVPVREQGMQGANIRQILRLHELGLVQGKLGNPQLVVHTDEGRRLWKEIQK
jgi:hypothetical protein